ncbi:MAG: ABC transporter permease [Treponema sp.]|jgi:simple sugar transport system permease protein|nr:ABC transporter permease [Treponema sp.]
MENIILFFKSTLTIMIPVFFAALGGLFPALAGTLNIALEGLLLAGAFSSLAVFYFSGSVAAAVTSAIISAMILSTLHAFAIFKLRANLFISGLAINLFSAGLFIVLSDKLFNTKGVVASNTGGGFLKWYVIIALLLLLLACLVIYKTPFGYRLRACEKSSASLVSLGIAPQFYQTAAILVSGFFCGIGGSFLSLNLGAYVPGMSAGKGWIALAVIFLGMKKPLGILAAAFIFALAESFSNYAQGLWSLPSDFILAFPYVCTLIAIVVVSIIPKKTT